MLEVRAALVREWIEEATAYIHDQLDGEIEIQSKSNRKDLVIWKVLCNLLSK